VGYKQIGDAMRNNIQFKVSGIDRLLTYEELIGCKAAMRVGWVRVIDLQTQRNWSTSYKNILVKFK